MNISYYGVGLDAFVTQKVTVGVDWDYYRPTFDGDSIFNWFTHNPMKTGTGRVAASITPALDVAASGGVISGRQTRTRTLRRSS